MAACCLVDERSFYGDTTGKVRQLIQWMARADPEWTLKLAVFLREELHLRSISQLILACAATVPETRPFIGRAFARVAVRPDDILEIAALLKDERHLLAKSLPASIRRAIGAGLNQLGETSFLKYRRARAFGLKHLLRLCHPRPATDRQSFLFRYVQDRRAWLALPEEAQKACPAIAAWEAISRDGSRDPGLLAQAASAGLPWEILVPHFGATRRVWCQLVPHLPIMALLRNLSNLHRSGALSKQSVRTHVRSKLTDRALLRKSRLLPFRFLSAYKAMIQRDPQVARWIEVGLEG
jgi:60 kDa SS-A/Ro ribonucleoprotein